MKKQIKDLNKSRRKDKKEQRRKKIRKFQLEVYKLLSEGKLSFDD